jgi:hypothetical protein
LFRDLSAASRVEYTLAVLVDVVATADERGEGVRLVATSVRSLRYSFDSAPQTNTVEANAKATADLDARNYQLPQSCPRVRREGGCCLTQKINY